MHYMSSDYPELQATMYMLVLQALKLQYHEITLHYTTVLVMVDISFLLASTEYVCLYYAHVLNSGYNI